MKNWLNGLREKGDKAKLAKEIIALANSGGGRIFIGFLDQRDNNFFSEIKPKEGELEAFTQDVIAEIVERYVSPPCQCSVEIVSRTNSESQHPVIIVPGKHRTPLFAAKASPDGKSLSAGKVYIRRVGGCSEEARNQDDWEKLIDRLVKARQGEMLDSIREILNPSPEILVKDDGLDSWYDENIEIWKKKAGNANSTRFKKGYWTVAFSIDPFQTEDLKSLDTALRNMPKFSGWPPFTYLDSIEYRPKPQDNCIMAYVPSDPIDFQCTSHDFWRICRDGKGFMLRPMEEDASGYINDVHSESFFSLILPIYRMTEILKFIEALAEHFSNRNASFHVILNYHGTENRKLEHNSFRYFPLDRSVCYSDSLESSIKGQVTKIETNIEELILRLLTPIYEQFNFMELSPALVKNVVKEALSNGGY